jgi:hypothetical protein
MDAGAVSVNSLSNGGVIRGMNGGPNRNVTINAVKNIDNNAPGSITGGNGAGSPGIAESGGWVKLNAGTTLVNSGSLKGGQGGAGGTQNGDGGDVEEKSGGDMTNKDGTAEGGDPGGAGAKKGKPRKEAGGKISMNGGSRVTGYACAIVAGDSVVGRDLAANAINATTTILITACPSGVIDLRANPNGEDVLVAGSSITLRGSAILLDGGVTLAGISSPDATGTTCATPGVDPTGLLVLALIMSSAGALALARRHVDLRS